jgi:teichuronic acid biosynthesis glycosyltransferase TuaG
MPRVSVIIPAFNAEAHIAETLRSIETQTFGDWEVVVGDDCSTDATAAIASGFGNRVNVVSTPENAGPATARNSAIACASGELVAFLDADDYWLPSFLEQQVALFDKEQATRAPVGVVACDARILDGDGFQLRTYMEITGWLGTITTTDLLRFNPIFVSAVAPRAVVDEVGGFCADIFGAEDRDLWLRIVELGYRVVANPEPLAVYRVTPASVSSNPASMARAMQTFYRRALERENLSPRERRITRRELRLQRAVEQVALANGTSLRRMVRALPLLVLAVAEHPKRWPAYAQMLVGRKRVSAFPA